MLIRDAVAADIEPLTALTRRTIDACYRSFLGDQAVDEFIDSGDSGRYVADHLESCSVLQRDKTAVGLVVCAEECIDLLMVDHLAQRQGYGTSLLAHVEQSLFRRYDELWLESFEGNANALAFYAKNGWTESSRYLDEGSGFTKVRLTKRRGAR